MELDVFARGLVRRWFMVILMTGVGLLSAYLYFWQFGKETAVLTVAAIEPAVTQATQNSTQAQITFDSVIQSQALAQRVIDRLGLTDITAYDLSQDTSARLATTLVPNVATPLYLIQVKHRDPDLAILIANTAVDEARTLFLEMNALDIEQYRQAYEGQLAQAQADREQAIADFERFRRANGIYDLDNQIDTQMGVLLQLVGEQRKGLSAQRAAVATGQAQQTNLEEIRRRGAQAAVTLGELAAGEAEYNQLLFELNLTERLVHKVMDAETQFNLQETLIGYNLGLRESLFGLAQIKEPVSFDVVSGEIQIIGTAEDPNFEKYEVQVIPTEAKLLDSLTDFDLPEVRIVPNVLQPEEWIVLGVHETQVEDGVLETWDTTTLPDGGYTIRLRVVRTNGQYSEDLARGVWVNNTGLVREDDLQTRTSRVNSLFNDRTLEVYPAWRPALERSVDWTNQAQENLMKYEQEYGATTLSSRIAAQVDAIAALNDAEREMLAEHEKTKSLHQALQEDLAETAATIRQEREELERLVSLQPKYERLLYDLQLAQSRLNEFESIINRKLLEATTSTKAQVKLLDSATIKPRLFLTIAIYLMAGLMGLVVGLVLAYVLIYFDRTVYMPHEAEKLMGEPVLVTIPKG